MSMPSATDSTDGPDDLRPRQRKDERDKGEHAEGDERPAPPHAPAVARGRNEAKRWKEQTGPRPARAQQIHDEAAEDHDQKREKPGVLEVERGDVGHEGCPFMSSYCSATAARRMASIADRTACCARAGYEMAWWNRALRPARIS